ncbi:Alphaalpha-trehalose-phosphate synthase [UDP-forming] 5 [Zea mays]|uniref:Alphaalpha-trehalose-phosphate synthase [UDP-forming] 5 n=1 Tax=Zea mays TaxID=4577 RepID=A0A1D6P0W1_MAIZE|nr:Alphaalpha-trehalose-phosphate synthase [UDP-forming] 5 [Zea mays]
MATIFMAAVVASDLGGISVRLGNHSRSMAVMAWEQVSDLEEVGHFQARPRLPPHGAPHLPAQAIQPHQARLLPALVVPLVRNLQDTPRARGASARPAQLDLIGFHTFDYARHFLSCCGRMLGLSYEFKRGHIRLEYYGRTVSIKILPVGVHMEQLKTVPEVMSGCQQYQFYCDLLAQPEADAIGVAFSDDWIFVGSVSKQLIVVFDFWFVRVGSSWGFLGRLFLRRLLCSVFCKKHFFLLVIILDGPHITGMDEQDSSQWSIVEPLTSYGQGLDLPGPRHRSLMSGYNLTDVVVTGNSAGVLQSKFDGSCQLFQGTMELLMAIACNVKVHNVTIETSLDAPLTDGIVLDHIYTGIEEYVYSRTKKSRKSPSRNDKHMNKIVLSEHDDHKYGDLEPKPFHHVGLVDLDCEMQVVGPDSRARCFRSWPLALSPLPEAMRSGHACFALASLLLLWLGIAAAQKASSWKTLNGEASMT